MTVIEDLVVWMLAAYGCSSLLVALVNRFAVRAMMMSAGEPHLHYRVLLYNSEHSLEGVVRCLKHRSVLQGRPIHISFVDFGSTDDTLQITQIFERHPYAFACAGVEPATIDPPITIDLRRSNVQESKR
jgi:hypothetical protein